MTSLCACDHPVFDKLPEVSWRCVQCWTPVPKDEELQDPSTREEVRHHVLQRSSLNLSWPQGVQYSNDNNLSDRVIRVLEGSVYKQNQLTAISHLNDEGDPIVRPPSQNANPAPYQYYQYKSLETTPLTTRNPHLRILRLSEGEPGDPLHGGLLIASIENTETMLEYEAISYTWANEAGDSKRCRPLYLDNNWYRLPITENCEAALRRFRYRKKARYLWVDSICINQEDGDEKREQVGLMPEIYSRARNVLVYLGKGSKYTSDAMFALNSDEQSSKRYGEDGQYINEIKWLFSLPYFSRIWIIQELALARDASFYHGLDTQSLELQHSREKFGRIFKEAHAEEVLPLWARHCERRKLGSWEEIGNLIFDGMPSKASRPEDKIFALFGMIDGASTKGLVANYNLAVEQVYTGIATLLMSNGHLMNLLERVRSGRSQAIHDNRPLDLPSWVPDFRCAAHNDEINLSPEFCPVYIQPDSPNQHSQHIPEVVLSRTGSLVIRGYRILSGIGMEGSKLEYTYNHSSGFKINVKFQILFNWMMDIIMLPCIGDSKPYALHLRKTDIRDHTSCYTFIGLCKVGLPYIFADGGKKIVLQPEHFPIPSDPEILTVQNFLKENPHIDLKFSPWRLRFSPETEKDSSNEALGFSWSFGPEPSHDRMNKLTSLMESKKGLKDVPFLYDGFWYYWLRNFNAAKSAAEKYSRKILEGSQDSSEEPLMIDLLKKIEPWRESTLNMHLIFNWGRDFKALFGDTLYFCSFEDHPQIKGKYALLSASEVNTLFDEIRLNIRRDISVLRSEILSYGKGSFDIVEKATEHLIGNWGDFVIPLSQVPRGETATYEVQRALDTIKSRSNLEPSFTFISGSHEEFIII